VPIGRVVAAALTAVTGHLYRVARRAIRFLSRCARGFRPLLLGASLAWRTAGSALRTVGRTLTRVLARVSRTAGLVFGLVSAAILVAARAALLMAKPLVRTLAGVLRAARRATRTARRWSARILTAAGATGRFLAKPLKPVLRGMRVVVVAAAPLLIASRRRMAWMTSLALKTLARIGAATSRLLTRWKHAWKYRLQSISERLAGLSRRAAHGARVATGTARHRAHRLAASAPSADWKPEPNAPGGECLASFALDVHENEYLRPAESTVSAVISITSEIHRESTDRPEMVEVILLDCSASMGHPWDKILNARRATQAAVASLPDGVWFAVVRGAESAEVAYPHRSGLVQASDRTRREAVKAIARLQPVGGTAIGRWLSLARELVALRPGALGHALLLTDGKDEDETTAELGGALEECEGVFQCDCRGVGTDWHVEELRRVSTALLGTVDIIRDPAGMEADFRAVIEAAMSRGVAASIRIRTPVHARVTAFSQVSPTIVDLMSQARRIDSRTLQVGLGGWADERREYHLILDVEPAAIGSEMAASWLSIVVARRTCSSRVVRAIWTDDLDLASHIDPGVAHYTGQAELAAAVQEGLQAKRDGDLDTAAVKLRRAVQLASDSGNGDLLSLLARVVDVVDGDSGTVSLRRDIQAYDEMVLDTRSTRTVPIRTPATEPIDAPAPVGALSNGEGGG
jgi:hypothetical protein